MSTKPILSLGEALIDAVTRGHETREIVGGSLLNVAAGIAALNHDSALASWWGDDERGHRLDAFAAQRGISISPGTNGATHTTIAHADVDDAGHATYTFDLEWDVPELGDLERFGHLHIGSYAATLNPGGDKVADAVEAFRRTGTVSYDPNIRPAVMGTPEDVRDRIEHLVERVDVIKASDEDLAWLYPGRSVEETMKAWAEAGCRLVVVTCGAKGALAAGPDGDVHAIAPLDVPVGDTVGAGDSFMAGLLAGLADAGLIGSTQAREALGSATWDQIAPALAKATVTSNITVSHVGAYAPTTAEVDEILRAHPELV